MQVASKQSGVSCPPHRESGVLQFLSVFKQLECG